MYIHICMERSLEVVLWVIIESLLRGCDCSFLPPTLFPCVQFLTILLWTEIPDVIQIYKWKRCGGEASITEKGRMVFWVKHVEKKIFMYLFVWETLESLFKLRWWAWGAEEEGAGTRGKFLETISRTGGWSIPHPIQGAGVPEGQRERRRDSEAAESLWVWFFFFFFHFLGN